MPVTLKELLAGFDCRIAPSSGGVGSETVGGVSAVYSIFLA